MQCFAELLVIEFINTLYFTTVMLNVFRKQMVSSFPCAVRNHTHTVLSAPWWFDLGFWHRCTVYMWLYSFILLTSWLNAVTLHFTIVKPEYCALCWGVMLWVDLIAWCVPSEWRSTGYRQALNEDQQSLSELCAPNMLGEGRESKRQRLPKQTWELTLFSLPLMWSC